MKYDILIQRLLKLKNETWDLADVVDPFFLSEKDRIFHSGIILEESEFLVELQKTDWKDEEVLEKYYDFLKQAKSFYARIANR